MNLVMFALLMLIYGIGLMVGTSPVPAKSNLASRWVRPVLIGVLIGLLSTVLKFNF